MRQMRKLLNFVENSRNRIKSGKFGHQVNSDTHLRNPDETAPYEPSHQDFHCLLS